MQKLLQKIRRENRPKLKKALIDLQLDMPLPEAEKHATEILDAESLRSSCHDCPKNTEKILSCYMPHLTYNKETKEFHQSFMPCPLAARTHEERKYQKDMEENMLLRRRFFSRTFDNFEPSEQSAKILAFCKSWVSDFQPHGKGLYIFGSYGCGKTHLAVACMQALKACYQTRCTFLVVPEFVDSLKSQFGNAQKQQESFDYYAKSPVLVIDDLGEGRTEGGRLSSWVREKLFTLINYRYEAMLPVIVTSAYNPKDLRLLLGEAAVSRLTGMCHFLHICDGDHRRNGFHIIE